MDSPASISHSLPRGSLPRVVGFLSFWMILCGSSLGDLPVGAFAALLATWTSLRLLPAGEWRLRPIALGQLTLRFLCKSIVAGIDVAWRALDPRLPLRPGFVTYSTRLPPGSARNVFTALTSLLPGTVPAGTDAGLLVYHCLDLGQPIASQLAAEETALLRAVADD